MKTRFELMQFSGDLSAPTWRELPRPINGAAIASDASKATKPGCESLKHDGCKQGAEEKSFDSTAQSAAPPFAVGDRVMIEHGMRDPSFPAIFHGYRDGPNGLQFEVTEIGCSRIWYELKSDWYLRAPTPSELATHWPDEWIPCTNEAQRLAIGDIDLAIRWSDGIEWEHSGIKAAHCGGLALWGAAITHYKVRK